jgi:hypothetical protein
VAADPGVAAHPDVPPDTHWTLLLFSFRAAPRMIGGMGQVIAFPERRQRAAATPERRAAATPRRRAAATPRRRAAATPERLATRAVTPQRRVAVTPQRRAAVITALCALTFLVGFFLAGPILAIYAFGFATTSHPLSALTCVAGLLIVWPLTRAAYRRL